MAQCADVFTAVYFFFPETTGRQLEEVDQIFRDSKTIFDPVKTARALPPHTLREINLDDRKAQAETVERAAED